MKIKLITLLLTILSNGISKPASSSSHWICTCFLAEGAVLMKVLMKRRHETWKEDPFQLLSIPGNAKIYSGFVQILFYR